MSSSRSHRFSVGVAATALTLGLGTLGCGDTATPPESVDGLIAAQVRVEGAPFADGTVVLTTAGGQERSIETDEEGRARFGGLEIGSYTVSARAPGKPVIFDGARVAVLSRDAPTASVEVTGTWDRSGTLTVRVEAGGEPVQTATVSLIGPWEGYGRIETSQVTASDGRASFAALVPGTYATSLTDFDATLYSFSTGTQAVSVRAGTTAERLFEGERLQQVPPSPEPPR